MTNDFLAKAEADLLMSLVFDVESDSAESLCSLCDIQSLPLFCTERWNNSIAFL